MIWSEAAAAATQHPNVMTGLFITSLNEMIDTHGLRLAAIRNRIPTAIWVFLFLTAGVGMLSIGYQAGLSGSRRSVAATALYSHSQASSCSLLTWIVPSVVFCASVSSP